MNHGIYFRVTDYHDEPELKEADRYFYTTQQRTTIPAKHIIIPRYSALPFYKELEKDCENMGSKLINSYSQHLYAANLSRWYQDLKDFTPKTWFNLEKFTKESPEGEYVLKGETNSKKFSWDTHMFARNKGYVGSIYFRLLEDGLIGTQSIVIREFVPLKNYGSMPSGVPISDEYRCFVLNGEILSVSYYWSNEIEHKKMPEIAKNIEYLKSENSFLRKMIKIVSPNINFYAIDIAQTQKGDWIVIELNDGSMSGLSSEDPRKFYLNMHRILNEIPQLCPTCNTEYNEKDLSVCSDAFHCCRSCKWMGGKVLIPCLEHFYV